MQIVDCMIVTTLVRTRPFVISLLIIYLFVYVLLLFLYVQCTVLLELN